jgi:peptidoglycan/LPS O-acetylase OafA/YrhL
MVVFHHFPMVFGGHGTTYFRSGYAGVTVFFVLSGFVISWNYMDRARTPTVSATWNYLIARFARVYPLYVCCLLFIYVRAGGADRSLFISHLLLVQAWLPRLEDAFAFNPQTWSVSVEILFYLTFPLLALILDRIGALRSERRIEITAGAILAVMLIAAAYLYDSADYYPPERADHFWLYRYPLPRLGDFLLGVLASEWCRIRLARSAKARGSAWAVVTCVSVACILWLLQDPYLYSSSFSWDVAYAAPSVSLIIGLTLSGNSLGARFLSVPPIVLLGDASYALYLCQLLAGYALLSLAFFHERTILKGTIWLLILIALSVLLHFLIEKPARSVLVWLLQIRSSVKHTNERLAAHTAAQSIQPAE